MRLMTRPFRGYRELAEAEAPPSIVIGAARFLLVVGAFVAITATGRLAPFETLSAMFSFAWLPVSHVIALTVVLRTFAPTVPFRRAYGLFLESLGPWLLVFLLIAGACLFAPRPAGPVSVILGPLIVVATIWSFVLVVALFREALGITRVRTALAAITFYVVMVSVVVGYYFAAGQLWPILPW